MAVNRKDWGWDGKFGLFELSGSSRAMRDMNEGATQDDIDFSWQSGLDARDIAAILGIAPNSHTGAGATRGEIMDAARTHGREHPA